MEKLPIFGAFALAGNSPELPADFRTRSFRIVLLPDEEGRTSETDWEAIEDEVSALRDRIEAWAEHVQGHPIETVELPGQLKNRGKELWRAMKRVAVHAGGGDWPGYVDQLAVDWAEAKSQERDDGLMTDKPHILLLRHLAELWRGEGDEMRAETMVKQLIQSEPEIWGAQSPYGKDLTVQKMGRMLSKSGIRSGHLSRNERGYRRGQFEPVWRSLGIASR